MRQPVTPRATGSIVSTTAQLSKPSRPANLHPGLLAVPPDIKEPAGQQNPQSSETSGPAQWVWLNALP